MPPKAKRYRVWIKNVILNSWSVVGTELTDKQSRDMLTMLNCVDCRREEITDD